MSLAKIRSSLDNCYKCCFDSDGNRECSGYLVQTCLRNFYGDYSNIETNTKSLFSCFGGERRLHTKVNLGAQDVMGRRAVVNPTLVSNLLSFPKHVNNDWECDWVKSFLKFIFISGNCSNNPY